MTRRKAKRTRRGCTCRVPLPAHDAGVVRGTCRYGYCTELRCPACAGFLMGWGVMGCKCSGYVRWVFHPGMAVLRYGPDGTPAHAAVKPSLRTQRRHRGKYHP